MNDIKVNLKDTLEESFAKYAGMVIQDRAIVDVRDGLKPAARQLLYAQLIENIVHGKPFKKATKSVAAGMSHFYIHGDASAYSTLIRMGKPFAMRYVLQDVQGSYGNQMEAGNEAASRYVEMRMSELGEQLFKTIDKNTIDLWFDNYDGTEKFPSVCPSIGFYNLVQGSTGIGVGLASSIPQFNLNDMNTALVKLLWNRDIDFDEIYCAPDFCTGGIIINGNEVKESIKNGTGASIKIRSKIDIDYDENVLEVTEFPYGVYSNTICKQLEELLELYPNCGIAKFIDLTGKTPRIKITLDKKANPYKVKEWLYKNTSLQNYFSVNMVMLKDGKSPEVFGLKEAMLEYLKHSEVVLDRELHFDLGKAQARLHIVEGYLKALDIINDVVALIKSKDSTATAISALVETFGFTDIQAKAILDLKLQRLVNMEINKLVEEEQSLLNKINYINEVLTNRDMFLGIIETRLNDVKKKYGDDRRTMIQNTTEEEIDQQIEEKNIISYISTSGAVLAKEVNGISIQNKKTLGTKIKFRDKNDTVWKTIVSKNTDKLMAFSNKGRAYVLPIDEIPIDTEDYLSAILGLSVEEYITEILPVKGDEKYLVFATKHGMFKKGKYKDYSGATRKNGVCAITLKDNDEIVSVKTAQENDKILMATKLGRVVIFENSEVNAVGRTGMGVKGISLDRNDEVIAMQIVNDSTKEILTITTNGKCKRNSIKDYSVSGRGTKGAKNFSFKGEDDYAAGVLTITEQINEIIVSSGKSNLKMDIKSIPVLNSKTAQGVTTLNTKLGKINSIVAIENL